MQTNNYQGLKVEQNEQVPVQDELVVEAPLQININNESYTVVMRTPGHDQDLVRGLLYAEDIYKRPKNPEFEVIEHDNGIPKIVIMQFLK